MSAVCSRRIQQLLLLLDLMNIVVLQSHSVLSVTFNAVCDASNRLFQLYSAIVYA
jgi:hypothetical protein